MIQNMCCGNSAEYVLPRGQESKVWGTARRIIMDSKKGLGVGERGQRVGERGQRWRGFQRGSSSLS